MAVSLGFGIVISGFMVLFVSSAVAVIVEGPTSLVRKKERVLAPAEAAGTTS
jgi:hypothetical protein